MFYNVYSIFSFNEIDYLTYINLWMLFLYYWIITFFVVIVSSLLISSSVSFVNDSWLEFILTLFSLWLVLLIISPLFIMFIDYDSILLSSLLVYSLGYQWSWSFNLNGVFAYGLSLPDSGYSSFVITPPITYYFNSLYSLFADFKNGIVHWAHSYSFGLFSSAPSQFIYQASVNNVNNYVFMVLDSFNSVNSVNPSPSSEYVLINVSFDHFLVPTLSSFTLALPYFDSALAKLCFAQGFALQRSALQDVYFSASLFVDYLVYFISLNSILLLPCFLGFRFLIFSFDVIHSLGFYSLGFNMDAIPGRINYSFELSTLFNGEHRGFCYELCGTSHSSMLILAMSL